MDAEQIMKEAYREAAREEIRAIATESLNYLSRFNGHAVSLLYHYPGGRDSEYFGTMVFERFRMGNGVKDFHLELNGNQLHPLAGHLVTLEHNIISCQKCKEELESTS